MIVLFGEISKNPISIIFVFLKTGFYLPVPCAYLTSKIANTQMARVMERTIVPVTLKERNACNYVAVYFYIIFVIRQTTLSLYKRIYKLPKANC